MHHSLTPWHLAPTSILIPPIGVGSIVPLETLDALNFSPLPYKWIRCAIGIVVGEGDLSSSPDSLNVVDYNASLPAEPTVLHYHTGDEERRRIFPVDPDLAIRRHTHHV